MRASFSSTLPIKIITAFLLLTLASCGHTPLKSMVKLRNFDPATTDLEVLSVAVSAPQQFDFLEDGVKLNIEAKKKDGSEQRREQFVLQRANGPTANALIASLSKPGYVIRAYRLAKEDIVKMDEIRQLTRPVDGKKLWTGSLGIGTKVCRKGADIPKQVLISTYLRSSETGEYVPFLVDVDLMKEAALSRVEEWAPLCQ